ncbi:hypothetical protein RKD18_006859 [Streptomyces phaeoluteigriseus]
MQQGEPPRLTEILPRMTETLARMTEATAWCSAKFT